MDHKNCTQLDDLDYEILNILIKDSRTPFLEIARQCNVSGGTIHVRMKKIEDLGIIKGTKLLVDYNKLGYDICCFVGIFLDKLSSMKSVLNELDRIKEVIEVHCTSGEYPILAKIICKSTSELNNILLNKVQSITGIHHINTIISLSQSTDKNINFEY